MALRRQRYTDWAVIRTGTHADTGKKKLCNRRFYPERLPVCEVRRSDYLLWRGSLSGFFIHSHTQARGRQNLSPFTSFITRQIGLLQCALSGLLGAVKDEQTAKLMFLSFSSSFLKLPQTTFFTSVIFIILCIVIIYLLMDGYCQSLGLMMKGTIETEE